MAVLRATFPDGITGEPIWSLQSLTHLDGGPTWIVAVPDETRSACLLRQQSEDMLRRSDRGIRDFVIVDPTGVLWRIGQNIDAPSGEST
jgi:hypothetical protein